MPGAGLARFICIRCRFGRSLAPRHQFVGNFDGRVRTGLGDVLAGFHPVMSESLALGYADSLNVRLFVVGRQVTGDRHCADLFAEKTEPQGMQRAAFFDPSN